MKDKQYKEKALKRHLWEGKAAEYRLDYHSILKWYQTQRTRFSKLREGQPKKKSQKRSGDGLSSSDEEDPILAEEASENDSDRDKFIRRVFGFLKPHIRRHNKEIPASFKDKLALAETDRLVQFITREQPVNRATPFCKYLETELDRLHDACLEPAYEDITTVLNQKLTEDVQTVQD
ncbi:hypothetical protein CesoFtcFv8_010916 [Champsocephalus esox]|uniref:MADF domain-containing protein n=1 Tax=Champsocephalus esox TaxID=159716 RepID=A0AAN8GXI6_9TELE|nr:hypothetical protein CesoFtcFv8_010916 [Champsocephalus esox]